MESPASSGSNQLPLTPPNESSQVIALQAQIKEMRRSEDRLLYTVWGSLGMVVVVGIILAGFSWWSSTKVYERDKQALRDDLIKIVGETRSSLEQQLIASMEPRLEKIRTDLISAQEQRTSMVELGTRAFTLGRIADLQIFLHDVEGTIKTAVNQFNTMIEINPTSDLISQALEKLTAALQIAIQEQRYIPDALLADIRRLLVKYPGAMTDSRAITLQKTIDSYSSKVHPN